MRTTFLVLMLAPWLGMLASLVFLALQAARFQRRVPAMRSAADMARFKRFASVQMYVSFMSLKLMWVPWLAWIVGYFMSAVGWLDLLLWGVLPFIAISALALAPFMSRPVFAVRALPIEDPTLQPERDRVVDVWLKKKFPEW